MTGAELIFRAEISRGKPTLLTKDIKLSNFARFVMRICGTDLSASLFDLNKEAIEFNDSGVGNIMLFDGRPVASSVAAGEKFEILVCDEILAVGRVVEIQKMPTVEE
ncbi:hypothetical protein OQJ46_11545 [Microbulbifer thermotolerans]|uniref:Uncharacterized protein n=1 Tax=Microbulbifer thermotolerans TaxID=252514 RepID=A0AB35I0P9_MICTH|nr:hypothetical protein [Microbulbifer thermotolerans]MCX2783620.1 hypothetical protein [Microbulbifer thermotolerans]MCX2796520.1 hypothetical protein [Microbulbifer thermotolerans]MCX2801995.1 hypothetical protein [Microbulbifer thermotolerans]MCX2832337.1 hypothetical protein [Microbulbifer thermotolerans]MCX2833736.1 hypothetical protein [Microbulbifer thermotolerans]